MSLAGGERVGLCWFLAHLFVREIRDSHVCFGLRGE